MNVKNYLLLIIFIFFASVAFAQPIRGNGGFIIRNSFSGTMTADLELGDTPFSIDGGTNGIGFDPDNDGTNEITMGTDGSITSSGSGERISGTNSFVDFVTAGAGLLVMGGTGGTNNENLIFDLESDPNDVVLSTTTGVGAIDFGTLGLKFQDGERIRMGGGFDANFLWHAAGARDSFQLGLNVGNAEFTGYFSIVEDADLGVTNRIPAGTTADPALRIYSSDDTSANDYIEMFHDQTDGVITVGSGSVRLTNLSGSFGSGSAYVCVNDDGTIFASDSACP